jgi:hypothetical protein
VTESVEQPRCRWCGRPIETREGPGRKREFCKQSCRQADYISRQRSREAGLSEAELVVTREALEQLRDRLYVLEKAVEDVERDVEQAEGEGDLREAIDWLLEAAKPLVER